MIAGVNLIPIYHQQARGRRVYAMRWVGLCIGYALLVAAGGIGAQCLWGRGAGDVNHRLSVLQEQVTQDKSTMAALAPKLSQIQTTLAASRTVGVQPDWSVLLRLIAGLLDHKTVLSDCRLTPASEAGFPVMLGRAGRKKSSTGKAEGYVLQLKGLGEDQQAVAGYVLRLEKTGLFGKVTLVDTHKEPFFRGGESAIGFQIRCTLGNGTGGHHG